MNIISEFIIVNKRDLTIFYQNDDLKIRSHDQDWVW